MFRNKEEARDAAIYLSALFATGGIPVDLQKLKKFSESENRLKQIIINLQSYTYSDTIALHGEVCSRADENLGTIGFLREIAEINPEDVETYKGLDPNDKSAPNFLNAVKDFLQKFDDLPIRLQYVVVNLAPKQEQLLDILSIAMVLAKTKLPEEDFAYEMEILESQRIALKQIFEHDHP